METIESLIPDTKGNHLVVVLYFYEDRDKEASFSIPQEFSRLDIADINIRKLDEKKPLAPVAFFRMSKWLLEQFLQYPNSVFSFICSTDELDVRHATLKPERYRWELFECLFRRIAAALEMHGIRSKDIVVGPDGCQTYAKVFFRDRHSPVVHIVAAHLADKYSL